MQRIAVAAASVVVPRARIVAVRPWPHLILPLVVVRYWGVGWEPAAVPYREPRERAVAAGPGPATVHGVFAQQPCERVVPVRASGMGPGVE